MCGWLALNPAQIQGEVDKNNTAYQRNEGWSGEYNAMKLRS